MKNKTMHFVNRDKNFEESIKMLRGLYQSVNMPSACWYFEDGAIVVSGDCVSGNFTLNEALEDFVGCMGSGDVTVPN